MPLTSGKMAPDQDQKIRKNLRYLKENIDAKDLTDHFIEEGIFDFPDVDMINGYNPNTVASRNSCFFRLLFASGPRAYEVLLGALQANQQQFVVDKIESTQVNPAEPVENDRLAWLPNIPANVRTRRLVERDLSRLSQAFGDNWAFVMYELGLSKADVDHARLENSTSVSMQIYTCLNKWKMRVVNDATLENLVTVVADCDAVTVDWAQIKKYAEKMTA